MNMESVLFVVGSMIVFAGIPIAVASIAIPLTVTVGIVLGVTGGLIGGIVAIWATWMERHET